MHDSKLRDYIHELAKESYLYQLDRCDKVRDRILGLAKIFTILGGALVYLWSEYSYADPDLVSVFFYIPMILGTALFLVVIGMLIYVLGWGFKYEYIPEMSELQRYATNLDEYKKENNVDLDLDADFKQSMTFSYSSGATRNLRVNRARTDKVLRAAQIGICSFSFLLASLPSFLYKEFSTINLKDNSMSEDNNITSNSQKPSDSSPAPAAAPVIKPTFPNNTLHTEAAQRTQSESVNFSAIPVKVITEKISNPAQKDK